MIDSNPDNIVQQTIKAMTQQVESYQNDIRGLRGGRANVAFLGPVKVEAYGSLTPLSQVATLSVVDTQMLLVQVWDQSVFPFVEKALRLWNVDLTIERAGDSLRVRLPPMTEERRSEIVKVAGKMCESTKVGIRNARRDAMTMLKSWQKSSEISEDDHRTLSDRIQKATDRAVQDADKAFSVKKLDIMGG